MNRRTQLSDSDELQERLAEGAKPCSPVWKLVEDLVHRQEGPHQRYC